MIKKIKELLLSLLMIAAVSCSGGGEGDNIAELELNGTPIKYRMKSNFQFEKAVVAKSTGSFSKGQCDSKTFALGPVVLTRSGEEWKWVENPSCEVKMIGNVFCSSNAELKVLIRNCSDGKEINIHVNQ